MIKIDSSKSTPKVILDEETHQFLIEGQSYPENASAFYGPIIEWFKEYIGKDKVDMELIIKLLYVNTSSTQVLMYIFDLLDEAFKKGNKLGVQWLYDKENELARDTGEELKEDLSLPFEIIAI